MPKKVLTIAGSDASGGAGQLADLKVFEEFGVYGLVALTCIVTMDPNNNFTPSISELETSLLEKQCATAFESNDLAAVKTGMLVSKGKIDFTAKLLKDKNQANIVIDPVMVCKQGDGQFELAKEIKEKLLPLATIATPNLPEAEALTDIKIETLADMKKAAKLIYDTGCKNVVIKGGHRLNINENYAYDLFFDGTHFELLEKPKIKSNYNHGAGCSFAAAITASLALGYTPKEATFLAKDFVYEAIKNGFKANKYTGHVLHGAYNNSSNRFLKK